MNQRTDTPEEGRGGLSGTPGPSRAGATLRRAWGPLRSRLRPGLDEFPLVNGQDEVTDLLGTFQQRALQRQAVLRLGLLCAAFAETVLFPPRNAGLADLILLCYALYTFAMLVFAWRRGAIRHVAWAVPTVDLPTLAVLLSVTGYVADPDWKNPFISDWLLMVVIMTAFQLRPQVTAVTGALATAFYGLDANLSNLGDPVSLHHTIGHTIALSLVSLAAVLLSRIQQERVRHIAALAHGRASMLATTLSLVERDRRDLAEALHDGPLQSVLAARLDVDEAADAGPNPALDRADGALRDAARQLRSSVTELHPSVLDQVGLKQALRDLAQRAAERGKFTVEVVCDASPAGSEADRLLYNCAREFLTNAVKYARARHVVVRFTVTGTEASLSVSDDGIGLPTSVLKERVAQGHIGIAAQQLRLQEVGGALTVHPNTPTGTVVEVRLPLRAETAAPERPGG
ncbi:sensor histidine kinase [Streptomyces sp. NPDC001594]|uniref:sensor histidine kinase n=1 Tax=Streptomyces sp. NPDC001594 TaxID=3364590 RepID=UPI0036CE98CC